MIKKYKVKSQNRTNNLSNIDSSIIIEAHFGSYIKVYDNIHKPYAFASKIFENNKKCISVTIKDLSNKETIETLNNPHIK